MRGPWKRLCLVRQTASSHDEYLPCGKERARHHAAGRAYRYGRFFVCRCSFVGFLLTRTMYTVFGFLALLAWTTYMVWLLFRSSSACLFFSFQSNFQLVIPWEIIYRRSEQKRDSQTNKQQQQNLVFLGRRQWCLHALNFGEHEPRET